MKRLIKIVNTFIIVSTVLICASGYPIVAAQDFPDLPVQVDGDIRYIEQMNRLLDIVISKSSVAGGRSRHKLIFGGNLFLAHGAFIKYFSLDVLLKYADGLKEAGISRIELYIGPSAWANNESETIAKYDALIKHIRELGLEVVISPEYHRGSFEVKSVSELEKIVLPIYAEIAKKYQPDIFVVIHEPTTMAGRLGIKTTPQEWKDFVEKAVIAVKRASPKTKLGAGGEHYELPYYRQWLGISGLDYMTLNIYNAMKLKDYNQMIKIARAHGKKVYIEETWRFPSVEAAQGNQTLDQLSAKGIGLERYQELDSKWIKALTLYANAWGLEAITPFWTTTYFKYVQTDGNAISYEYNSLVAEAINKGERTPTFRTLQALAEKFGKIK